MIRVKVEMGYKSVFKCNKGLEYDEKKSYKCNVSITIRSDTVYDTNDHNSICMLYFLIFVHPNKSNILCSFLRANRRQ